MFVVIWATLFFRVRSSHTNSDLTEKPSVMIPPLTEGRLATLTCTAPSHCSDPNFTWTWTGRGENASHIVGNNTANQRQNSALTFQPSVEHHSTAVTCKVSCTGNETTEETVTLNVAYKKEPEVTGETTVKEGGALNLICSVDSFPPSPITWTKLGSITILSNGTGAAALVISNVAAVHSGQYICTATHLNNTLIEKVDVTVKGVKKYGITGSTTVKEGDALNLTCTVGKSAPSRITWTKVGSSTKLPHGAETDLQNDTGTATLIIPNVTAEHSGVYNCTAKHQNTTLSMYANVIVTLQPKILNGSGCEVQSDVLTCVCISEGFPLPTIQWPLLDNHTEYSVITAVSKHTVNSTVTLTVKDHSSTSPACVSSNENGEIKGNLTINEIEGGQYMRLLRTVTRLEIILAFLIGILLSTVAFCLGWICCRKKQKTYGNLAETLEMVTSQEDPLIHAGQAVEVDQIQRQEMAEGAEAVAVGKSDVDYSNIDFSLLKRKSPAEARKTQGTAETEYAEIQKAEAAGEGKEEEEIIGEADEKKHCGPEEKEAEDAAVYCTVEDLMGQI